MSLAAKQLLEQLAPRPYATLRALRGRRHSSRFRRAIGLDDLERDLVERLRSRVHGGPFAGMRYTPQAVGSVLLPKLLGCYEAELHDFIASLNPMKYAAVINIGCAEGYYTVGFALRWPHVRSFAFDVDPLARRLCANLARLNGVGERVIIAGGCDFASLRRCLAEPALIVSDCEGCEHQLLCPERVPALRTADILVELHECAGRSCVDGLLQRFASSHTLQLVSSTERDPAALPALRDLKSEAQRLAVSEFRLPGQQWALMTARAK
jgi:hypothetical protein